MPTRKRAASPLELPKFWFSLRLTWPPRFTTAEELGLPAVFAPVVKRLAKLGTERAGAQIAAWLRGDFGGVKVADFERHERAAAALFLVHLAPTDEVWAAARAQIDVTKALTHAYLPFGIGSLGLDALPRLIEAYEAKKITKQARWQYRHAIVAALAVAGSRGESWPKAYDRFLAIDPTWWFATSQSIFGNWHNDLQLSEYVLPLLYAAIAALPGPRARAILDAALAETAPKRFPMCFFALPLLRPHWRATDLPRAIEALRLGEDGKGGGFIDTPVWSWFQNDLLELGLHDHVLLERYRTGHSRHRSELAVTEDEAKLAKLARKRLPAPQLRRFQSNFEQMFGE